MAWEKFNKITLRNTGVKNKNHLHQLKCKIDQSIEIWLHRNCEPFKIDYSQIHHQQDLWICPFKSLFYNDHNGFGYRIKVYLKNFDDDFKTIIFQNLKSKQEIFYKTILTVSIWIKDYNQNYCDDKYIHNDREFQTRFSRIKERIKGITREKKKFLNNLNKLK